MTKKLMLIFLSVIIMSGCMSSSINQLSETSGSLKFSQASTLNPDLVHNINNLAFLLQDKDPVKNAFISSLSIYLALAMTAHGTAHDSYAQFMALLNPNNTDQTVWLEQLKALQGNLNAMKDVKLALSNSLWIRDSFAQKVKADFLQRNTDYFGAMIAAIDFNDPKAVDDINAWVKNNTNKLIEKTIDSIDPATIMFLINTIYFKGEWLNPFAKTATTDRLFHGSSDTSVPFMTQTESFKYAETDALQAILLPYQGNSTGMLIVMGKEDPVPVDSDETFSSVLDALQSASIRLLMPKVDIAATVILNDKLKALGLVQPFVPLEADFSALADADLFISKVLHKSRLKIDEAGTEAAAVTSISIDVTSVPVVDHEMVIDRPFQVFIVDLDNSLILFSGWLNEVKSSE